MKVKKIHQQLQEDDENVNLNFKINRALIVISKRVSCVSRTKKKTSIIYFNQRDTYSIIVKGSREKSNNIDTKLANIEAIEVHINQL